MKLTLLATLVLAACSLAITYSPSSAAPDPEPQTPLPNYIYPTKGVITSGFGWRWGRMHKGIDIAAATGTPIVASAAGTVTFSGWHAGGYGNLIEVSHPNGANTLYAHNSRLLVRVGEQVQQGQLIAEMGSTGYSTGPHCHFEIRPGGQSAVDPIVYLNPPVHRAAHQD